MDLNEVFSIFVRLADISEAEAEKYRFICENAVRSLRARLKDNIDESESGDSLNMAAAALAFKRYVLQGSASGELGGFTVGVIKVDPSRSGKVSSAEDIWREALYDIKDLLRDDTFIFGRIL